MRGGRGGRGRGGPMTVASIAAIELGKDKEGPVTETPELYPNLQSITPAPVTTDEQSKKLVDFSRSLANFWSTSVWSVQESIKPPEIETWQSRKLQALHNKCANHEEIKNTMTSVCGSQYFPPELLNENYVSMRKQRRIARGLKKLEDKEKNADGAQNKGDDDLFASEGGSSVGDEDYIVNHYDALEGDDYEFDDDGANGDNNVY